MTGTKLVQSTLAVLALAALAGCDIGESLGLNRHVPDETQVVVRPPLTLPPDYNLLPPGTQTSVSDAHEAGLSMGESGKTPEQQKREQRGFFGRIFHGDIFGSDSDTAAAPAQPASTTPSQDINGTPMASPPAPGPAAAPAPAPSGAQTGANTAPQAAAPQQRGFWGSLAHGDIGGAFSSQIAPAPQPAAPPPAASNAAPTSDATAATTAPAAPAQGQTQDTRTFWQKFLNGDVHDQEIINGK